MMISESLVADYIIVIVSVVQSQLEVERTFRMVAVSSISAMNVEIPFN